MVLPGAPPSDATEPRRHTVEMYASAVGLVMTLTFDLENLCDNNTHMNI